MIASNSRTSLATTSTSPLSKSSYDGFNTDHQIYLGSTRRFFSKILPVRDPKLLHKWQSVDLKQLSKAGFSVKNTSIPQVRKNVREYLKQIVLLRTITGDQLFFQQLQIKREPLGGKVAAYFDGKLTKYQNRMEQVFKGDTLSLPAKKLGGVSLHHISPLGFVVQSEATIPVPAWINENISRLAANKFLDKPIPEDSLSPVKVGLWCKPEDIQAVAIKTLKQHVDLEKAIYKALNSMALLADCNVALAIAELPDQLIFPLYKQDLFEIRKNAIKSGGLVARTDQFFKLLQTFSVLHDVDVLHRDIKPENIMQNDQKELVIVDFGFATIFQADKVIGNDLNAVLGTSFFMPPESFEKFDFNDFSEKPTHRSLKSLPVAEKIAALKAMDVYAYGLVLAECLLFDSALTIVKDNSLSLKSKLMRLFHARNQFNNQFWIKDTTLERENLLQKIDTAEQLVAGMIHPAAEQRLTFTECLQTPVYQRVMSTGNA